MYKLSINTNRNTLDVHWSNINNLAKYANIQAGHYLDPSCSFTADLLEKKFREWHQMFWDIEQEHGMLNFPDNSVFVDIGSGIGVKDLLLYSYVPNSKFYLIDSEGWDEAFAVSIPPNICYSNDYPIYNSWAPTKDAIATSNFDSSRFVIQDPSMEFPDADVVFSQLSWCFHYPKETYWDRVMSCLKTGGQLQLDVRILADRDIIGEISEELKSKPIERKFPKIPDFVDNYPIVDPAHTWSRCGWIKNV
jgi:hypothetical protein